MPQPLAYISGPSLNDPQKAGLQGIRAVAEAARFQVLDLEPLMDVQRAEQLAGTCSALIAWLDTLQIPGTEIRTVDAAKMQTGFPVPFPKDAQDMIVAGAEVMSRSKEIRRGERGLILPEHIKPRKAGIKVPTGMTVTLDPGIRFIQANSPAENFPSPAVMFDIGIAHVQGIPIFTLSLLNPKPKSLPHYVTCHSTSMQDLQDALTQFFPVALEPATEEFVKVVSALKLR